MAGRGRGCGQVRFAVVSGQVGFAVSSVVATIVLPALVLLSTGETFESRVQGVWVWTLHPGRGCCGACCGTLSCRCAVTRAQHPLAILTSLAARYSHSA